jgi:ATP-binding cassette, subfamily B, bacterial
MRSARPYINLLRAYIGPQWSRAVLLAALLLGSIGLQLVGPQLLRFFIDSAIAGVSLETLNLTALAFVGVALLNQLLTAGAQYVGESVGWTATNALRADLTLHCLRLDIGFHKARTPGELIERIDGDVTALAGFFSRFVVNVLGNVLLLIGVLIVVTRENAIAGAVLTAFALAALVLLGRLRNVAVKSWHRLREVVAQLYGFLGEYLAGTEDIRSSGSEGYVMNGLAMQHRALFGARRKATVGSAIIWSSTLMLIAVGNALAFGVGAYLWSLGAITIGTVFLLFQYTDMLRHPIEQLRHELDDMQQAFASIARVQEILLMTSRLPAGAGVALPTGPLAVELDSVSFAYDKADGSEETEADGLVLRDVSLRVPPGRVLGVLGRTGSGKTTLARLLLRFYDPTAGAVRIGGVDLRAAALDDVRRRSTMVTQDVQLFHASVRDNVTFFDDTIEDPRIESVLERIGLAGWLRGMARGKGSRVGLESEMRGGEVSAGEAQLLAFARVFLRDPGLVILDEASSHLDPATERHIERAVDALFEGRTGVVIAHRLTTVHRCDDIVILDEGRVVESGQREVLANDPSSRFAALLRSGLEPVLA